MGSVGAWNDQYSGLAEPESYGDDTTYRIAGEFLADCAVVHDWGCGKGWFKQFVTGKYVGIDGSHTPFANKVHDLATWGTKADGILLRHVLEHNDDWQAILDNAVRLFKAKLCIVLFTPLGDETTELMREVGYGDVPVISFRLDEILDRLDPADTASVMHLRSGTFYGHETVVRVVR